MGDCFRCPRPVSASATEVIATSLVAAAALAAVTQRFFDFFGVWVLSGPGRPGHRRKGFFAWPNNFDFLRISEVGLALENKGEVRGWLVITGKFAPKCALCKKENADFSRGGAESREKGRREPQIHADSRRTDKFSRKGAKAPAREGEGKGTADARRFTQTGPESSPLPPGDGPGMSDCLPSAFRLLFILDPSSFILGPLGAVFLPPSALFLPFSSALSASPRGSPVRVPGSADLAGALAQFHAEKAASRRPSQRGGSSPSPEQRPGDGGPAPQPPHGLAGQVLRLRAAAP